MYVCKISVGLSTCLARGKLAKSFAQFSQRKAKNNLVRHLLNIS